MGGYPSPFTSNMYETTKKADVFFYHSRYNWVEMRKVMRDPENIVRLASVREPKSLLRSIYNHVYSYEKHKGKFFKGYTERRSFSSKN